jgi:membrane fusion protein, multidrug efflux system
LLTGINQAEQEPTLDKKPGGRIMQRKTTIALITTTVILATGVLAAATIRSAGNGTEAPSTAAGHKAQIGTIEVKPIIVETQRARIQQLTELVKARGVTQARVDMIVAAELPGRVVSLGADVGDKVTRDQVLARIDRSSLAARRRQARARVELARVTHDRMSDLGAEIVTGQRLDEARFNRSGARAELAAINADLSKAVVRGGMDGVVSRRFVEPYEYVNPGTPLYRLVDHSKITIEAQLAETQVSKVKVGARVTVRIDALEKDFEGEVTSVSPAADSVSRTFTMRVEVNNPHLEILVGMSASLEIATRTHEDALMVVQDWIVESSEGPCLYVVEDGQARRRPVVLGPTSDDKVMITAGLVPGEELVVIGQRYLKDGYPVRIVGC